jgi:hypothetical protein
MKTIEPVRLLKLALYTDAAASAALAVAQLLLPSMLASYLSLPGMLITETGIFLAGYALILVYLASTRYVWAAAVQVVVIGNVGWALACMLLAATRVVTPSALGIAFLLFQAGAVLLFAWLQHSGLRASLSAAPRPGMQLN